MKAIPTAALRGTGHTSYPTPQERVTLGQHQAITVVQSVWEEFYPHRPYRPAHALVELQRNPDAQRRIRETVAAYAIQSPQH